LCCRLDLGLMRTLPKDGYSLIRVSFDYHTKRPPPSLPARRRPAAACSCRTLRLQAQRSLPFEAGRIAYGPNLLSEGWLLHPMGSVNVYDIGSTLENSTYLGGLGIGLDSFTEESSATSFPAGRLAVALRGT
jgi:hypothetical protein